MPTPKGLNKAFTRNKPEIERAVEIACKRMASRALQVLEDILENPDEETRWRIAAAKEVLDRGFGRPKQSVETVVRDATADSLILALNEGKRRASITVEGEVIRKELENEETRSTEVGNEGARPKEGVA